jgi:hypothetical protein
MSQTAKVAWMVAAALLGLILVGAFLGDDESDAWVRPVIFLILFPIIFGYIYWREKRKGDSDD